MEKSFSEDKGKLEVEVKGLKTEELETKNIGITKFKEFKAYKSSFTLIVTMFLAKKKIKMKRLLQRHHNIENLSYLANVGDKPTFFTDGDDKAKEEREEVTQNNLQRGQPLA